MNVGDPSSAQCELRKLKVLSDEILMTYVKEGHPDALGILFDRYRRLVLSVAWHILRDRGEAEDLVQSVFLEVLQAAAKFDSAKGTAKSWILQYAYHRGFNRRKYLSLRGITNYSQPFSPVQEPAVSWCNRSFEIAESEQFIREVLEHLNGKQRRILELAFYEGVSMREAAEITGESFDTVRHHFYRAIGNLRSMIHRGAEGRAKKYPQEKNTPVIGPPIQRTHRALAGAKSRRHTPSRRTRLHHNIRERIGKGILARA